MGYLHAEPNLRSVRLALSPFPDDQIQVRGGLVAGAGLDDDVALLADDPELLALVLSKCRRTPSTRWCRNILHTENILVCCCGVGSDRAAGVGASLGTLNIVRVDGRPCLGRCFYSYFSYPGLCQVS